MAERILIVDDEVDMLMLLRMIIEDNTEYAVETTNNPSEAIQLLTEGDYDLVISDLKMPGIDGLELFDRLRGADASIPVVIITAYGSIQAADEALQKGVSDFITKPFKKERILITIRRTLELRRLQKENTDLRRRLDSGQ